jgi:hypothetical protein
VNVWREMPRAVYDQWCNKFGAVSAKYALKLPAVCVAGRWMSVAKSEGDIGNLLFVCVVGESAEHKKPPLNT